MVTLTFQCGALQVLHEKCNSKWIYAVLTSTLCHSTVDFVSNHDFQLQMQRQKGKEAGCTVPIFALKCHALKPGSDNYCSGDGAPVLSWQRRVVETH